jgi:hypothetical protein
MFMQLLAYAAQPLVVEQTNNDELECPKTPERNDNTKKVSKKRKYYEAFNK